MIWELLFNKWWEEYLIKDDFKNEYLLKDDFWECALMNDNFWEWVFNMGWFLRMSI